MSGTPKCPECGKSVYFAERQTVDGVDYHGPCVYNKEKREKTAGSGWQGRAVGSGYKGEYNPSVGGAIDLTGTAPPKGPVSPRGPSGYKGEYAPVGGAIDLTGTAPGKRGPGSPRLDDAPKSAPAQNLHKTKTIEPQEKHVKYQREVFC